MLKKSITYEDFNGDTVTEDFFFHLSAADLIELEMSKKGGLSEWLQRVVKSNDGAEIMNEFKKLILASYGQKSEDGKRFIKSQALRDEFQSTEAFSTLFLELCTNAEAAAEFTNGVVPTNLERQMQSVGAPTEPTAPMFDHSAKKHPASERVITRAEMVEMDADELKHLIAQGATISDS